MRKRITSLLLTLVMLLSLVPAMGVTASAAEPEWKIVNTFDELKEAMQQGKKTNIKLGKDINTNDEENHQYGLTSYDTIRVGNTITLDLNGKKLTLNSGQNRMSLYIRVVAGRLTVQDSVGGGEIFLNDEYKGGSSLMQVEPEATFTLKSGTLRATTPKPRSSGITLIENVGTVNIEGGTLTCTQKDGSLNANGQLDDWSSCYALLSQANSDGVQTTISGGTFTGYVQVGVNNNGKQSKITGDHLDVYVISFDPEKRKISLGVKDRTQNPWDVFMNTYKVGDVANVRIVKLMTFGAFAEVVPGVDGLIHISQIADRRIDKPSDVLSEGQMVDAKITAIDEEKKKISLSIRALLSGEEEAPVEE